MSSVWKRELLKLKRGLDDVDLSMLEDESSKCHCEFRQVGQLSSCELNDTERLTEGRLEHSKLSLQRSQRPLEREGVV